ncbi:MAG: cobalamin-dependent protein, partial [Deltaproteobacteria bacterium]|nr:cobalamin-dependent protein [Deltaproteobacteria bacterium]
MNILLIEINPFVQETTPISLGYIASFLKSKGFCVKILTIGQNTSLSRSAFHEIIRSFKPSLVGFSAYQRVMLYITGLAKFIKSINKNIKIIIGGPQATFMPSAAFTDLSDVDYICRSPGELTMLGIARAIENRTPFLDISGVSYKDDNDAVFDTPELEGYTDLDRYPSAYLNDVFDYSHMKEAIMLTSRGCPHHCIYCYTPNAFK